MENCPALIIEMVRPLIDYIGNTQPNVGSYLVGCVGQDGHVGSQNSTKWASNTGKHIQKHMLLWWCPFLLCWNNRSLGFPLAWAPHPGAHLSFHRDFHPEKHQREMWSHSWDLSQFPHNDLFRKKLSTSSTMRLPFSLLLIVSIMTIFGCYRDISALIDCPLWQL